MTTSNRTRILLHLITGARSSLRTCTRQNCIIPRLGTDGRTQADFAHLCEIYGVLL